MIFLYIRIKTLLIQTLLITKETQVWSMQHSQASMSVCWSCWKISGLGYSLIRITSDSIVFASSERTDERNIKVDAVNQLGFSALMKAAVQGHISCVSTLLEYGANDAIKDSGKGLCAQGWAQYCNRNQVVVQLSQFPREQVWRP